MIKSEVQTEAYTRVTDRITRLVDQLNEALGLTGSEHRVTYGYLGNDLDIDWFVFLPHPGRVGTYADRMGGHRTNDVDAARTTLSLLAGAVTLARWQAAR